MTFLVFIGLAVLAWLILRRSFDRETLRNFRWLILVFLAVLVLFVITILRVGR